MLPQAPHQATAGARLACRAAFRPRSLASPLPRSHPTGAALRKDTKTQGPASVLSHTSSVSTPPPGPLTALPRRLPCCCAESVPSLLHLPPRRERGAWAHHLLPSPSSTAAARLPRAHPTPPRAANSIPRPSGKCVPTQPRLRKRHPATRARTWGCRWLLISRSPFLRAATR